MRFLKKLKHFANNFLYDQDEYDLINQIFADLNPTKEDIEYLINHTNDPDTIIWLYQYYAKQD